MNYIRMSALVGAAVITSAAAFAEDPNSRVPALAMSAFSWSGFYAGVSAGGSWYNGGAITGSSNVGAIVPASNIIQIPTSSSNSASFTGGGLIGINYQIGGIVVGAETDFNYIDLKSERTGSSAITVPIVPTTTIIAPASPGNTFILFCPCAPISETLGAASYNRVEWYGTIRARLGFLPVDRVLLYGTGGMAYGKVETSNSVSNTFSSLFTNRFWQGDSSEIKWGWTVGAGAEYAISSQVAVRTEYLYVDLGTSSVVARFQGTDPVQSQIYYTVSRDNRFSVARVALSYKF